MGTDATDLQRMRDLEAEVRRLSKLYYEGAPEVSDAQFDALWAELEQLEAKHPQARSPESPTQKLYEGVAVGELFSAARHETPMLSLAKAYSSEEIDKWLSAVPDLPIALMPKFDGVSLSITYLNGKLTRAATRGDGVTGEDVTVNVIAAPIKGLPEQLNEPVSCEVRGEIVMRRSDWSAYNAAHPDKPLINARNGAAGTLRAKSRDKVADRLLSFFPFDLLSVDDDVPLDVQLRQLGFEPERYAVVQKEADRLAEIEAYIERIVEERAELDYESDGVVLRVADRAAYRAAGSTSHHPRAALAFKPAAEEAETTVTGAVRQVGKSGAESLVIEVAPVFVAGTTIRRISAHNYRKLRERDIRVGDRVVVVRRGDVIPHIERVVDPAARTGDEQIIPFPQACVSCGSPLREMTRKVRDGDGAVIEESTGIFKCENLSGCPAQRVRRLIHWASRAAADIDAIGEVWIEKMADAGDLNSVADFYTIDKQALLRYDRMGSRLADKMLESIDTSKELGLRRALIGWSIPFCSEGTAKRLCLAGYESVEDVARATADDLVAIEDIGPVVAESIVSFFGRPQVQEQIRALRDLGVNLDVRDEDRPVTVSDENPFAGKTVVFTGSLESFKRSDGEQLVQRNGGKSSGSVSAKTDMLVAGPGAGSKLAKAQQLNEKAAAQQGVTADDPAFEPAVSILDEQQFLALLSAAGMEL